MAANKRIVRVYTLSTCPLCKRVKNQLSGMGIAFEAIDVDLLASGEQWLITKEVKKYNPASTYPTLVVEDVVLDFSEENLRQTLLRP